MQESSAPDVTIHISSKSHLNLTFNLYQCGVRHLAPGAKLSIPADDTFTMLYANKGVGRLHLKDIGHPILPETVFFTFPDEDCRIDNPSQETLELAWLNFSGYGVENYLSRAGIHRILPVLPDKDGYTGRQFNYIIAASQKFPNRYCRMVSTLYDIFGHLLDLKPENQQMNYYDSADFAAVRAVSFIEHHYSRNISVDDIAAALGISRKHLYGIFNDVLKIPPKQYLIYYRIEKACLRLKSSDASIQEIAESVGYASQFYFAKEFKRLMHVSPSEYRKNPVPSELFSYQMYVPALRSVRSHGDYESGRSEPIFSDVQEESP